MGIDTKGVVITECKDVFNVRRLLDVALRQYSDPSGLYKNAPIEYILEFDFLMCRFNNQGNLRNMFVFFGSDSDYQHIGDKKIVLLLGAWGNSVEIMESCLSSLSELGQTYIWKFDATGDFVKC